jgi:hypothetical protein
MDVAADLDGNIYVADRENHVVQVIVLHFKREEGRRAQTNNRTVQEAHTCAHTSATRHAHTHAHLFCRLLQVYGEDGTFLRSHGGFGIEEGKFHFPCGIAVDQVRGQEEKLEGVLE